LVSPAALVAVDRRLLDVAADRVGGGTGQALLVLLRRGAGSDQAEPKGEGKSLHDGDFLEGAPKPATEVYGRKAKGR
jgi:hypothetical protein